MWNISRLWILLAGLEQDGIRFYLSPSAVLKTAKQTSSCSLNWASDFRGLNSNNANTDWKWCYSFMAWLWIPLGARDLFKHSETERKRVRTWARPLKFLKLNEQWKVFLGIIAAIHFWFEDFFFLFAEICKISPMAKFSSSAELLIWCWNFTNHYCDNTNLYHETDKLIKWLVQKSHGKGMDRLQNVTSQTMIIK